MIINNIHIDECLGDRLDAQQFHPERLSMIRRLKTITCCKLKEVAKNVKTVTTCLSNEDVYIGLENVTCGTGEYIPGIKESISTAAVFKKGDILFSKLRPYLNKVYLAEFSGKSSTEFYILEATNILPEYLAIILRSDIIIAQTKHLVTGNTLPRLQTSDIENLLIPYPSSTFQQKIVDLYTAAQNAKLQKDKEAKELLESIDDYLLEALSINPSQEVSSESVFTKRISEMIGNRLDVSFYKDRFEMVSEIYPNKRLSSIVDIDPTIRFTGLADDTPISFIPMECIDDTFGEVKEQRETTIAQTKGYTKFEENDLLWAKITPCMQNGKSAIARNLTNGIGCGSTEYYVIRPKTDDLIIDYVYLILRHHAVLKAAQNSFGGSAGQQRVSSQYMKSIVIPHPPIDVQKSIIETVTHKKERAKQLQNEGSNVLEEAKATIEKMILG
jgi:type I restriction enzyme S subunit